MLINIQSLAEQLGKSPQKRVLPNGKEIEQITWEGNDLKEINHLLHNKTAEFPEHIKIDGAAPAWLVAGLCHELHPCSCSINTPQGYVPVGCKSPRGEGFGDNLQFNLKEADGWTIVEAIQKDSSTPLDLSKLTDMEPPELPMGSKIILSGRMPNVVMCNLANAYQHQSKAIGFYQPGTGATIAITHDPSIELGSCIPEKTVTSAEDKDILNQICTTRPATHPSFKK